MTDSRLVPAIRLMVQRIQTDVSAYIPSQGIRLHKKKMPVWDGETIDCYLKDLNNVLDCAHTVGAPVPMTASVMEIMQWLHNNGKGQCDHSAIAQYYEYLTGIQIGR